jgi:hypothetical protein
MGKKRKVKEPIVEPSTAQTDVTKDIDDIFAARKPTTPSVKAKPVKAGDVESSLRKATTNPQGNDLASVQKQVQAAKSKRNAVASQGARNDDFADIRGTNKSIISIYVRGG